MGERSRPPLGPGGRLRVLVTEADPAVREVLVNTLSPRFGTVFTAATATEALPLFERCRPDLAVIGAGNADGGAASLLVALRQASRHLPLFLLGAAEDILTVFASVAVPGVRPLLRPFAPAALVEALEEAALDVSARRSVGEAWELVKFFLDESPHPAAIFTGPEVVSINRAFLRFLGLSTFHEFQARGLPLEDFLADSPPAGGLAVFARRLVEDRLDREHRLRLVNPKRPDLPPHVFQAVAARLPGRDRWLLTLSDITELELERQELLDLANLDPLTRVFNRRKLEESISDEVARSGRYATPLAAMMLDIDHFKAINDTHGHDAGDAVLVELASRLGKILRHVDRLARFGGEEFVVVAPGIGLASALDLAERLRRTVAEQAFAAAGRVTISIGVATLYPGEPADALLKRADEALYRAKDGGRNRVESEMPPQRLTDDHGSNG